jgi:hypothetical protein
MEQCKADYGGDLGTSGGQSHKHWADLLLHKGVDGVDDESLHSCPAAIDVCIILCVTIWAVHLLHLNRPLWVQIRKQLPQGVPGEVRSLKNGWQCTTIDMLTCLY